MIPVFFKKRERCTLLAALLGSIVILSLLLAVCGSTSTSSAESNPTKSPAPSAIATPTDLLTPGVLTVGSDTTYPPQEYIDATSHKATGFDIDLITAIAQRIGLQVKAAGTYRQLILKWGLANEELAVVDRRFNYA
ncbi:MAG: transporter substrate-binding domain-containing protein [Ktedonobacteraceae bacterium]|nr:transporter substrate-binding domain-containing protein [Ktedonobacteraceae bacterium]